MQVHVTGTVTDQGRPVRGAVIALVVHSQAGTRDCRAVTGRTGRYEAQVGLPSLPATLTARVGARQVSLPVSGNGPCHVSMDLSQSQSAAGGATFPHSPPAAGNSCGCATKAAGMAPAPWSAASPTKSTSSCACLQDGPKYMPCSSLRQG